MEQQTQSPITDIITLLKPKADQISPKNMIESLLLFEDRKITQDCIDYEVTKKNLEVSIQIDRGDAVEQLSLKIIKKKKA